MSNPKVASRPREAPHLDFSSQNIFALAVASNASIRAAALAAKSVATVNTKQQTYMKAIVEPAIQQFLQVTAVQNQ